MEFVHGSPLDEDEYLLNTAAADDNLDLPGHAPLIFFGHTHIQGGFVDEDGESRPFRPIYESMSGAAEMKVSLNPGMRCLINPGSVGQPRDNDWRAAFALYETRWRGDVDGDVLSRSLRHQVGAAADSGGTASGAAGGAAATRAIAAARVVNYSHAQPPLARQPSIRIAACLSHAAKSAGRALPGGAHRWRSARQSRARGIWRGAV